MTTRLRIRPIEYFARCGILPTALATGLLLTVMPAQFSAHLSIIGQGRESASIPNVQDRFGQAVVAGDFNGDGYEDLPTGAPHDDTTSPGTINGSVIINYGSDLGWTHVGAQDLSSGTAVAQSLLFFGRTSASADLDGFDDLAVGMPYKDEAATFGSANTGAVAIFRAVGSNGPAPNIADVYTPTSLGLTAPSTSNGYFGFSLAAGNESSGSHDELVVGRHGFNNSRGEVVLMQGAVPESTAYDMALLSRAAMNNPLFASIVGTSQWSVNRTVPKLGGGLLSFIESVNHWFVPPLKSILPEATGIKGGGTGPAQITGVYAARHQEFPWGTAIATSFYTPNSDGVFLFPEGAALLARIIHEPRGKVPAGTNRQAVPVVRGVWSACS